MNKRESIEKTKKCFEESFRSGSFYNKQFAERYKQVEIVCLDIVEETLEKNR